MANTISVNIHSREPVTELLLAELDSLGFEGILEHSDLHLEAYMNESFYVKNQLYDSLNELSASYSFEWTEKSIPDQNWNQKWESSFEPVFIGEKLRIRAPFHEKDPQYPYELIIEPKMSFGTGHHGTTFLMAEMLLEMDLKGKIILDAGSGTGILSILGEKLGAKEVIGFDVEEWAFENAKENALLNACRNTRFYRSDANGLPFSQNGFDITLANITKNVLKEDIPLYLNYLRPNSTLLISGFFEADVDEMAQFSKKLGLGVKNIAMKNNWAAMQLSR